MIIVIDTIRFPNISFWFAVPIQSNHNNNRGYHFAYNQNLCKIIYSNALKQRKERLEEIKK
jgi:hypothetical protein